MLQIMAPLWSGALIKSRSKIWKIDRSTRLDAWHLECHVDRTLKGLSTMMAQSAGNSTGSLPDKSCNPADFMPAAQRDRQKRSTKWTLGVKHSIEFVQINLQHNKAVTALLCNQIAELEHSLTGTVDKKNKILGINSKGQHCFVEVVKITHKHTLFQKLSKPIAYHSIVT